MHVWGDENFDWKGLNKAGNELRFICTKIGRLGGQIKEKFGTLRFYAQFHGLSVHNLFWSGYVYYQPPLDKFLWLEFLSAKIATKTGASWLFFHYQKFFYKWGYRYILWKYPHLRQEIGNGADHPEFFAHKVVVSDEINSDTYTKTYYYKDGTILACWKTSK